MMDKQATIFLIIILVTMVLLSGCSEFAGDAMFKMISKSTCIERGKFHCDGDVLIHTEWDTQCKITETRGECEYACRESEGIGRCLSLEEYEALGMGIEFGKKSSGTASGEGDLPLEAQCNDGIDNDGDGAEDYPDDCGCGSLADVNEANCDTSEESVVIDDGDEEDLVLPSTISSCTTVYGTGYACVARSDLDTLCDPETETLVSKCTPSCTTVSRDAGDLVRPPKDRMPDSSDMIFFDEEVYGYVDPDTADVRSHMEDIMASIDDMRDMMDELGLGEGDFVPEMDALNDMIADLEAELSGLDSAAVASLGAEIADMNFAFDSLNSDMDALMDMDMAAGSMTGVTDVRVDMITGWAVLQPCCATCMSNDDLTPIITGMRVIGSVGTSGIGDLTTKSKTTVAGGVHIPVAEPGAGDLVVCEDWIPGFECVGLVSGHMPASCPGGRTILESRCDLSVHPQCAYSVSGAVTSGCCVRCS